MASATLKYSEPAGGPGRWRVISLCAGGRHSMVLAVPDGAPADRGNGASSSGMSLPQLSPLPSNGHAAAEVRIVLKEQSD